MSKNEQRAGTQKFPAKTEKKGLKPNTGYKPAITSKPDRRPNRRVAAEPDPRRRTEPDVERSRAA